MGFEQEIAIWTGAAASVAALLSAGAAFWTVRKMNQQIESSYVPILTISSSRFKRSTRAPANEAIFADWAVNSHLNTDFDSLFHVPLRNLGLGVAKDISVSWRWSIDEDIAKANELAQQTATPIRFEFNAGILEMTGAGRRIHSWKAQKSTHLDYVLPAAVEKAATMLRLPQAFVQFSSAWITLTSKIKGCKLPEFPVLRAEIWFSDIGEKLHTAVFEFQITEAVLSKDNVSFDGYLSTRRCL